MTSLTHKNEGHFQKALLLDLRRCEYSIIICGNEKNTSFACVLPRSAYPSG